MLSIRCVKACRLIKDMDGVESEITIPFGKWVRINSVCLNGADGYIDIHLADGGLLIGVDRKIFELNGVDIDDVCECSHCDGGRMFPETGDSSDVCEEELPDVLGSGDDYEGDSDFWGSFPCSG